MHDQRQVLSHCHTHGSLASDLAPLRYALEDHALQALHLKRLTRFEKKAHKLSLTGFNPCNGRRKKHQRILVFGCVFDDRVKKRDRPISVLDVDARLSVRLIQNDNRRFRLHAGSKCMHSRSEEHTSEIPSLMRISYAVLCLKTHISNQIQNET